MAEVVVGIDFGSSGSGFAYAFNILYSLYFGQIQFIKKI